jgi:hypothetical protein
MVENVKPKKLSPSEISPQHQNHAKMNARILGNAMAVQRWNDQKVASHVRVEKQHEWDKLVIIVKQCASFFKLALVKLALEQFLQLLGLNAWGMGSMPQYASSWMEKDEDLQKMIRSTHYVYAR